MLRDPYFYFFLVVVVKRGLWCIKKKDALQINRSTAQGRFEMARIESSFLSC